MSVPQPEIDRSDGRILVTETRQTVAPLTAGRADLLVRAAREGRRVVLVSDEVTRLTLPLREALRDADARWVVEEMGGTLRDGFDGRRLASVVDGVDGGPLSAADDVSVRYLRPVPAESVQLIVSQSVRHKAAETTVLGGTAELVATRLTGAEPAGWGAHEPAVVAWDRERLSELARGRMPEETTVVVVGAAVRPMVGTVRAARTVHGLEETTQLLLGVGAPGSDSARAAVESLPGMFADLALHHMPLFGFVTARTGRADLSVSSVLEAPPMPLGMLIGPPGVRELGLDVAELAHRHGARVVGRPRIPGLFFPLGTFTEPGWEALSSVLRSLGAERVRAIFDQAGTETEGVLRAARP